MVVSEINNEKWVTNEGRPARTAWQDCFDGRVVQDGAIVGAVALASLSQPLTYGVSLSCCA